jgi:hypothetical protein
MSHPKSVSVTFDHRGDCATVVGKDAFPLLLAVDARPLWSPQRKAWTTNVRRGEMLLAVAQERRYIVACEVTS